MIIASEPMPYSGAFKDVIYRIEKMNPGNIVDVLVYDNSVTTVIGHKRFYGAGGYDINVANYLQPQFKIAPLPITGMNISNERSRNVYSMIEVGGSCSGISQLTAGVKDAPSDRFMSDAPMVRTIESDQIDELSFCKPRTDLALDLELCHKSGQVHQFSVMSGRRADDVGVVSVCMSAVGEMVRSAKGSDLSEYTRMDLALTTGAGGPRIVRSYMLSGATGHGVRVCWLNPYGAFDYYTFAVEQERTLKVDRAKIHSVDGYRQVGAQVQTVRTLLSGYEPCAVMEWIAQIVVSPQVWIYSNGVHRAVDVLNSSVQVNSQQLMCLSLQVRDGDNT